MTREDMLARLEERFPQKPAVIKRKPEHKPYRAFAMPTDGFYGTQYYANNCKKARERIQRRQRG